MQSHSHSSSTGPVKCQLSQPDVESFPTISFYCSCGKRLYTFSTNIIGYRGQFECSCGERYVCLDSLIAVSIPSARAASAALLKLEETRPSCRTRRQRG